MMTARFRAPWPPGGPFYAVARGFRPGIYLCWRHAEQEVKGFENALHKRFDSIEDAVAFVRHTVPDFEYEREHHEEQFARWLRDSREEERKAEELTRCFPIFKPKNR